MSDEKKLNDTDRSKELGMSLDEFQSLMGFELADFGPLSKGGTVGPKDSKKKEPYAEDDKKKKASEQVDAGYGSDNLGDIGEKLIPFETDDDVNNKTPLELNKYWDRPVESDGDKALYYGFHIHGKDNVYGLHAHYPGAPLGGGHTHSPQNKLGYHTHRYNTDELMQFKFARPGLMINLDGPHTHQHNAPDGKHIHSEENFGPEG